MWLHSSVAPLNRGLTEKHFVFATNILASLKSNPVKLNIKDLQYSCYVFLSVKYMS